MKFATIFTAVVAAVTLASAARAEMPVLTDIPAGYSLYARADTLAALKEQTKPTLVYNTTEFLWIAKAADGARYFTQASARVLKHAGKTEYIILNPGTADGFDDGPFHARVTVRQATSAAALKTNEDFAAAGVVSVHPQYGTLYQMSINRVPSNLKTAVDEERIYVMHDPDNGWRFVDALKSDYVTKDPSLSLVTRVSVAPTWTGSADRPLSLAFNVTSDLKGASGALTMHEDYTRFGTLPLAASTSRERYVVVGKGDTFSGLAVKLAAWQSTLAGHATTAAAMKQQLAALNPGINPDVLRLGSNLAAPNLAAAPAVAKAVTSEKTLPAVAVMEFPK